MCPTHEECVPFRLVCQAHMMYLVQEQSTSGIEPEFGRLVRESRQTAKLSQADVSAALARRGLSLDGSAISRIESGDRSVRLSEAALIAEVLEIPLLSASFVARATPARNLVAELGDLANRATSLRRQAEVLQMEYGNVQASYRETVAQLRTTVERAGELDHQSVVWLVARLRTAGGDDAELLDVIARLEELTLPSASPEGDDGEHPAEA